MDTDGPPALFICVHPRSSVAAFGGHPYPEPGDLQVVGDLPSLDVCNAVIDLGIHNELVGNDQIRNILTNLGLPCRQRRPATAAIRVDSCSFVVLLDAAQSRSCRFLRLLLWWKLLAQANGGVRNVR